ncbi:MAG TPA: hypothetical protein DEF48_00710, partial [Nostoc sp. UBA8866]|nr:hypothetical protein [Nostoc sp. UBA8866]
EEAEGQGAGEAGEAGGEVPNPQSPIPSPQSPIPNPQFSNFHTSKGLQGWLDGLKIDRRSTRGN